ncbi:helix-turn-helix domain-containing protein [Enhygromyxa salina]|nr:helix-turn-helix transcriptional regulator [Enhygromyxa salina]
MNTSDFGKRLRELREGQQLSQERIAKLAGLSADTISRIELGRISPTLDTMVKIGRALGLPVLGLIRDDFDRPDELAALIRELPARDQNLAFALVGAMRVQVAVGDD